VFSLCMEKSSISFFSLKKLMFEMNRLKDTFLPPARCGGMQYSAHSFRSIFPVSGFLWTVLLICIFNNLRVCHCVYGLLRFLPNLTTNKSFTLSAISSCLIFNLFMDYHCKKKDICCCDHFVQALLHFFVSLSM
jgi:hypothetical protein